MADGSTDLPRDVVDTISTRGSMTTKPLAQELAFQAAAIPGIEIRGEESEREPTYFQIRHRNHPHVLVYVNVHKRFLTIDYRLPRDFRDAGDAERRTDTHSDQFGIRLRVADLGEVPEALRLLRETIYWRG